VKYQFLKEKLWGLVSGMEVAPMPPIQAVGESEADEMRVSGDTAAQEAYRIVLGLDIRAETARAEKHMRQ
jgi:hypothetical protein